MGSETYDAEELRVEAEQIFCSALEDGRLIPATGSRKRNRNVKIDRQTKRRQVGGMDRRLEDLGSGDCTMIDLTVDE